MPQTWKQISVISTSNEWYLQDIIIYSFENDTSLAHCLLNRACIQSQCTWCEEEFWFYSPRQVHHELCASSVEDCLRLCYSLRVTLFPRHVVWGVSRRPGYQLVPLLYWNSNCQIKILDTSSESMMLSDIERKCEPHKTSINTNAHEL